MAGRMVFICKCSELDPCPREVETGVPRTFEFLGDDISSHSSSGLTEFLPMAYTIIHYVPLSYGFIILLNVIYFN